MRKNWKSACTWRSSKRASSSHEFITVEHLLLALLDNPSASEVLQGLLGEPPTTCARCLNPVHQEQHADGGRDRRGRHPADARLPARDPARDHARAVTGSGKKEVTGANVLVAIFGEKDSHAVYYLHQQGVTRLDVVNFIAHGIKKSEPPEPGKGSRRAEAARRTTPARGKGAAGPVTRTSTSWRATARSIR